MIGTPYSKTATKIMLLGSGELGKEFAIEAQRLGLEVIAVDRYEHAPAMQVAHRSHVINMLDGAALEALVRQEQPDFIVPEIEAIATDTLVKLEQEGFQVVPTARAAKLTMDREGIRRLAAETLQLKTSQYFFADDFATFESAVLELGFPCMVKPLMSSSGKGQSVIRNPKEIIKAWEYSQQGGRSGAGRVIIEQFIPFDYEITLLTVRHKTGTLFCEPIGHRQEEGDYRESWQPHPMPESVLKKCQDIAKTITDELGGFGIFGVELMIQGENVYFSEVSPRPHDTGMVTLLSQDLSEFALHLRAILGLPIPEIKQYGPTASSAILFTGKSSSMTFEHLETALNILGTALRLFGKPAVAGKRRLGVALARGATIVEAIEKAKAVTAEIVINE